MKQRTKSQRKPPTSAAKRPPSARDSESSEPARRRIKAGALLVGMALLAYSPLVRADFIWDDESYVVNNGALRSVDGLRRIWVDTSTERQYYPLVHTTFWLEYHVWGLHALGYHLVNVLLHSANAVLLWRLLVRLRVPGAWFAAAIFAVHPVEVESVAWVTERKNVLSLALALSAVLCYLRFEPAEKPGASAAAIPGDGRWRWYFLSLALFAGALLSKTVVASLPAVLLVIYWWKRGRIDWIDVVILVLLGGSAFGLGWLITNRVAIPPRVVGSVLLGVVAAAPVLAVLLFAYYRKQEDIPPPRPLTPFFVMGVALASLTAILEKINVGAVGRDWDFTLGQRLLIAGRALWFYATKLLWPRPLVFFYPRWGIDESTWWQFLFPATAVGMICALWFARTRMGRGPLAAALIFAGVLVPALGFFNVFPFRYSFVADHFQYHASVALIALAAAGMSMVAARLSTRARFAGPAAAATLLVALAGLAFSQTFIYRDLETLYGDTIAKNPTGWTAYSNLGVHVETQGRHDEAAKLFAKAVQLRPDDATMVSNMGHIRMKLGERDGFQPGELDQIMDIFNRALELEPTHVPARRGLGFALLHAQRHTEAIEQFRRTLTIRANDADSLCGLGAVLGSSGRKDEAEECFRRALRVNPACPDAFRGLSILRAGQNRMPEAIHFLQETVRVQPSYVDAHMDLGNLFAEQRNFGAAIKHYSQVVAFRPRHPEAWHRLGMVYGDAGQMDRAIECFQQYLRLEPDSATGKINLQKALDLKAKQTATK